MAAGGGLANKTSRAMRCMEAPGGPKDGQMTRAHWRGPEAAQNEIERHGSVRSTRQQVSNSLGQRRSSNDARAILVDHVLQKYLETFRSKLQVCRKKAPKGNRKMGFIERSGHQRADTRCRRWSKNGQNLVCQNQCETTDLILLVTIDKFLATIYQNNLHCHSHIQNVMPKEEAAAYIADYRKEHNYHAIAEGFPQFSHKKPR